jgi:CubicO group peptidase (beta-lactamase class C family)
MKFQVLFSLLGVRAARRVTSIITVAIVATCGAMTAWSLDSTETKTGSGGISSADGRLRVIDPIVQQAVRDGQIPGAVVVVGHDGHVVYRKAYGWRALEPRREMMTLDTVFDCASLTKVIATTTAVMQLVQEGKVKPNDPVMRYLPEFAQNGKEDITVRQLLVHYSGMAPDLDLTQSWQGKETAYRMAFESKPQNPPGSGFVYSDINFIVLGALVERVSGQSLDAYTAEHVFGPLKMARTRYLPPASWRARIAPTELDENKQMLRGVVHDPTARRMGGVAGHAGLFATGDDLAKFAQALLNGGAGVLAPLMVEKMTSPQQPPNATSVRGFGWDIDTPFSSNRGDLLPVGSYGHTGFTGTSIWIDPTTHTYIVLLTNAVHSGTKGTAIALRTKVATAVAAAIPLTVAEKESLRWQSITGYNEAQSAARKIATRNGSVKTGIDVLEAQGFEALRGLQGSPAATSSATTAVAEGTAQDPAGGASATVPKRKIGLLTNQTGITGEGRRTIDVLAGAPGIQLAAIFSPEHGVTGTLDTTDIKNSTDLATGVSVFSVYGGTDAERRPSLDVLKGLDAIVIDLQDAGTRIYTYETTLGYFLEAAAQAGI